MKTRTIILFAPIWRSPASVMPDSGKKKGYCKCLSRICDKITCKI